MHFTQEVYQFVYGNNVDIVLIEQQKTLTQIYNDIMLKLANDDITKISEIRKLPAKLFLEVLSSKIQPIPRIVEPKPPKIGFEIPEN